MNHPFLRTQCEWFLQRPDKERFQKIQRVIGRLRITAYDPHTIREITRGDPVSQGEFWLGYDPKTQLPVTLHLNDIFKHMIFMAGTGGGKTTLLRVLVSQLLQGGINVVIFQKKRQQFENLQTETGPIFTTFHVDELRLSLFETRDTQNFNRRCQMAVSPIHEIWELQNSIGFLSEATNRMASHWPEERIRKEGFPTLHDLRNELNQLSGVKPHQKKYIDSAENILRWLWEESNLFRARKGMYESIRDHPTIVNYDDGQVKRMKLVLMHLADRFVEENQDRPDREKRSWLFVLDDALEFVENQQRDRIDPVINKINLTRENQLGFLFAFQTIAKVEPRYLTSVETKVAGCTKNYEEAIAITHLLGIREECAMDISLFQPGQFILNSPGSYGSVKFQGVPFEHPHIEDWQEWERENEVRTLCPVDRDHGDHRCRLPDLSRRTENRVRERRYYSAHHRGDCDIFSAAQSGFSTPATAPLYPVR